MADSKDARSKRRKKVEPTPEVRLVPSRDHPDHVGGAVGEVDGDELTPIPDGPLPHPPFPPRPEPRPEPGPWPRPGPIVPQPRPIPWPIDLCAEVSGRYRHHARPTVPSFPGRPPILPGRQPILPFNLLTIVVRVDVDRFYPQDRISIEVRRLFPRATAHAIADVTSDRCVGYNHRRISATISYRDGDTSLIRGDQVLFEAARGRGFRYGKYTLTLSGSGTPTRRYDLSFESPHFDPVAFEVDRVENAGQPTTTFDLGAHPNRPADLPEETISLATVYERAGFDVTMRQGDPPIPITDAGANGTWSDAEMHDAMVTYWSAFADRPQWAMWVLFAARHDIGRGLGGVMFDDIGDHHRQGTAIFTDSFIQDVPQGDPAGPAWRQRMVFWTAVHETGHAFNLAHSWQKAMGVPEGAPGDPWTPLANAPEARSFMNYPFRVSGGQSAFFADFRFRFTDEELLFMRHAPRRFVQMGNSDWFVDHGFEAPARLEQSGRWKLEIRPNREVNTYAFLEPVTMEFKLTNRSTESGRVDEHLLTEGHHLSVFVQREGGRLRAWRPMVTHCRSERETDLKPDASMYGAHMISASSQGWLVDEPGFYKVQAAIDMGDEVVVSNVLRLHVRPAVSSDESQLASTYFTEDVARALAFRGAPSLPAAMDVLQEVVARCEGNPAALHASVALTTPRLRAFKRLRVGADRDDMEVHSEPADVDGATKRQLDALTGAPDAAADTLGHIHYFDALEALADTMKDDGDTSGAKDVMKQTVDTMQARAILPSVVKAAERKLARMT